MKKAAIFIFTFTVGALAVLFAQNAVITVNTVETSKAIELIADESEKVCQIHGEILKSARVQKIYGEFEGSLGKGDWSKLEISCKNCPKKRMAAEDAQFYSNQSGGLNTWIWWENYEADKTVQFPHGYDWVFEECEASNAKCSEITACSKCRAAELMWKKEALHRSRK